MRTLSKKKKDRAEQNTLSRFFDKKTVEEAQKLLASRKRTPEELACMLIRSHAWSRDLWLENMKLKKALADKGKVE